jgi:hypothetical protein
MPMSDGFNVFELFDFFKRLKRAKTALSQARQNGWSADKAPFTATPHQETKSSDPGHADKAPE